MKVLGLLSEAQSYLEGKPKNCAFALDRCTHAPTVSHRKTYDCRLGKRIAQE